MRLLRRHIPTLFRANGVTILETTVSLIIVAIGFGIFIGGFTTVTRHQRRITEETAAKASVVELLEFFRAFGTGPTLLDYLDTNPADASLQTYPLCSQVNKIDRATQLIAKPDPGALLPASEWDGLAGASNANRFYQVHIVNIETLEVQDLRCGQRPGALSPSTLSATERMMVTVGIDWYSGGRTENGLKQVAQSIILPN